MFLNRDEGKKKKKSNRGGKTEGEKQELMNPQTAVCACSSSSSSSCAVVRIYRAKQTNSKNKWINTHCGSAGVCEREGMCVCVGASEPFICMFMCICLYVVSVNVRQLLTQQLVWAGSFGRGSFGGAAVYEPQGRRFNSIQLLLARRMAVVSVHL